MRRGRDHHLHGQVFLPLGMLRRHSQRCLAEPLSNNEKKGASHETSYGMQVLGLHALLAHLFAVILPLCRVFFLSHLDCTVSRCQSKNILPSTPCLRCRQLDSTVRAVLIYGVLSPCLGFTSAGVAPLSPRFRKILDETVMNFAVFPSC